MRRIVVAALSVVLTACALAGRSEAPDPSGPTLGLDITNASDRDVVVGYEFGAPGSGGSGEVFQTACRRDAARFQTIVGSYHVTVEGKTVWEDTVLANAGSDEFLVIRVRIGPDGGVEVAPPVILAAQPNVGVAIPGCG